MTYADATGPTTEYPNFSINKRYNIDDRDTSVKYDFDPLCTEYLTYLKEENLTDSKFTILFKEFELTQVDRKNIMYVEYLQYLADNSKIQNDRELYSHVIESLDYLVSNNLLHINKKDILTKELNEIYYSKNKEYKKDNLQNKYSRVDYSKYKDSDDCREVYNNQLLNELHAQGGELYLYNNNKFLFKLVKDEELIERPKKTVETILSRHFGFKVKITDEVLKYDDIDMDDFIFKASSFEVSKTKLIGGFDG